MNIFNNNFIKSSGRLFSIIIITSLSCCSFLIFSTTETVSAQEIKNIVDWSPNYQSPVITPSQQNQPTLDQVGPPSSEACGISPANNKWNYCLLAPLNGLIGDKSTEGKITVERFNVSQGLGPFFSKVYRVGIMAAIALSVVVISFGGIQMAISDSISGTDSGRKKINAAFAGLFIALFSFVILYTINPALVNNGEKSIFPENKK